MGDGQTKTDSTSNGTIEATGVPPSTPQYTSTDAAKVSTKETEALEAVQNATNRAAAIDKDADNVLDRLLGVEPEKAKPTSKERDIEDEEDDREEVAAVPDDEDLEADDDTMRRAVAALIRDGIPRDTLDKLIKEDPKRVKDWGLKRATNQRDIDSYKTKLDKAEKAAKEVVTTRQTEGRKPAEPVPESEIREATQPFVDLLGDAAREPAEKFVKGVYARAQAMADEAVSRLEPAIRFAMNQLETIQMREARAGLKDKFPSISDDEVWEKVQKRAASLIKTGDYDTLIPLIEDSARIELAEETTVQRQKRITDNSKAKSKGQPTQPGKAQVSPKAMTADQKEDAILDAILSGKDKSEIRRISAGL
jgi:hypothetical protein